MNRDLILLKWSSSMTLRQSQTCLVLDHLRTDDGCEEVNCLFSQHKNHSQDEYMCMFATSLTSFITTTFQFYQKQ